MYFVEPSQLWLYLYCFLAIEILIIIIIIIYFSILHYLLIRWDRNPIMDKVNYIKIFVIQQLKVFLEHFSLIGLPAI